MNAHASGARPSVFDAARDRASIEDLVSREKITLKRQGREMRGSCPLCGAGAKSKTVFAVNGDRERWNCYGCGEHGDVVDLERALRGGTLVEAAKRLTGGEVFTGEARARPAPKAEPTGPSASDKVALELWREGRPLAGTLAWRYLVLRGIDPAIIEAAAPRLRYHPFAKWSWDPGAQEWIKHPAMLAQVETAAGPTGGVHATYLARDGSGKAPLSPAKRMWGAQVDAQGRPGGAWLIGPDAPADTRLGCGEGIETTLALGSLALRRGEAMRLCAALTLNRLQGGEVRDEENCVDPYEAVPDPERPPFTWPKPLVGGWPEVVIALDRDMSEVKVKGRTPRGQICEFKRPAEARARLCGRLAVMGWVVAGSKARAIAPSAGSDFNDELRRLLARERTA